MQVLSVVLQQVKLKQETGPVFRHTSTLLLSAQALSFIPKSPFLFLHHTKCLHIQVSYIETDWGGDSLGSVRIKNKIPADSGAVDLG